MIDKEKPLKTGYTTGSCATAATIAAIELLLNNEIKEEIQLLLPSGDTATIKILDAALYKDTATARVKKYSGDDPDITNGAIISASVRANHTRAINFFAGDGVGVVTRAGLQIAVGEPAINPVPREMMTNAVRASTNTGMDITIGVEGGRELAEKTFNPRLGIEGGISIIGTSGIVRPFSHAAVEETVRVNIDVAAANNNRELAIVAGHFGMKAAIASFMLEEEQIIEVSNAWGAALEQAKKRDVQSLLLLSHPGKLAKLIAGHFNTHSSGSPSALPIVQRIAAEIGISIQSTSATVDGLFKELPAETSRILADTLANMIRTAAQTHANMTKIAVVLIDMQKKELGHSEGIEIWQRR